jgi:threonine aldolase
MIDLRSDTVTRPSAAMRSAMAEAEVGDDVFADDPTVNRLEERIAEVLGKETAVYVPTGTMANQIALRAHTEPGDIVIMEALSHVIIHENGAPAALAGVSIRPLPGRYGVITPEQVRAGTPRLDPGVPPGLVQPASLVVLENTHNDAGGTIWPLETLSDVAATARSLGLGAHLDGARLWNAAAATGVTPAEYADGFDTVSVCFSKGLGAPVGSALAGREDLIHRARRFKAMYGGGFRQAGIIAAGALYGLEHNRDRLVEDHINCRRFAEAIAEMDGIDVDIEAVQTNMTYFEVDDAPRFEQRCREAGVDVLEHGPRRVRAVFHLDVSAAATTAAIDRLAEVAAEHAGSAQ